MYGGVRRFCFWWPLVTAARFHAPSCYRCVSMPDFSFERLSGGHTLLDLGGGGGTTRRKNGVVALCCNEETASVGLGAGSQRQWWQMYVVFWSFFTAPLVLALFLSTARQSTLTAFLSSAALLLRSWVPHLHDTPGLAKRS
jgi:hypothetical protein